MTPSVTRSTPSNSAIGGTSERSNVRLARIGLPRYLDAMEDVVPPQMICLPSLEKNSDIIRFASSRLDGGPNRIFIGSRRRILTTQDVVSSPGLCPYRRSHSSTSMVDKFFAVYPPATNACIYAAISSRFQPKLYSPPRPACGHPSLMAMNTSSSHIFRVDL